MLKLPQRQEIQNVYTNHRYRSFSTFLNNKPRNIISADKFVKLKNPRVHMVKPSHQKTEKSLRHYRNSSSDFDKNENVSSKDLSYITPKKMKS